MMMMTETNVYCTYCYIILIYRYRVSLERFQMSKSAGISLTVIPSAFALELWLIQLLQALVL